jgi:hypothetical protein
MELPNSCLERGHRGDQSNPASRLSKGRNLPYRISVRCIAFQLPYFMSAIYAEKVPNSTKNGIAYPIEPGEEGKGRNLPYRISPAPP